MLAIMLAKAISLKGECEVLAKLSPTEIINTLLEHGYDYNFRHFTTEEHFEPSTIGYYFKELLANMDKYIPKLRPEFHEVLERLRENGFIVFLLTNSHYGYTKPLMTHLFGSTWTDVFHPVIVRSRKPKFYF